MTKASTDFRLWQQAAVLGSLWAAVEIVVGSFLHNLNLPFAGSMLAAFGVAVMTAGHRASPSRGLIWRAALICALMKSVSPSAVILGPMVGILMEGLVLEACVDLSGANAAGYLAGGALAVSWSLIQKIISTLFAFGPNIIRLYVAAYAYASKSLGVSRFGPFDLVATLFVLECVVGAGAAIAGMRLDPGASRREPATIRRLRTTGSRQDAVHAPTAWSYPRLAMFAAGLVAGMALVGTSPIWLAALYVGTYAALAFRAYPRALAKLRRPVFWLQVAGVLLLAGLLLGGLRNGQGGALRGLGAGSQMALRAVLVLLGFTAISVELRNPRILAWLERRRVRGLSDALGLAFGALPEFTAALADRRSFWRHPFAALTDLMHLANIVYVSIGASHDGVVILTGETGSGKTTRAGEVVGALRQRGLKVGGVLARGSWMDSRRSGFDLVDLWTGDVAALCREAGGGGHDEQRWGRFEFTHAGLELGRKALTANAFNADVVVIDEVGPLELAGGGWADSLDALLTRFDGAILIIARRALVDAVKARWAGSTTPVCDVERDDATRIVSVILERLPSCRSRVAAS